MKGDAKVIEYLNKGLRSELTAVNQYWLHYRMLEHWGFRRLAQKWREESIEEMRHADRFVHRILFLEGRPNMQSLEQLRIGQDVKKVLECDLAAEYEARGLYQEAAEHCGSVRDYPTRELFEDIMADEEGHIDFLETQLETIARIGLELYCQAHIGGLEKAED
jgi:bacterioferritin